MDQSVESACIQATKAWFEAVVLGLNLCPFAHQPAKENTIRMTVVREQGVLSLWECLEQEARTLNESEPCHLETTLLILADGFDDFYYFSSVLEKVDRWLVKNQWQGIFQVASFHPNYQFYGTDAEDASNLTNCSPFPIIHLLRENSISEAVDRGANTDSIPDRNIALMESLSSDQINALFPFKK